MATYNSGVLGVGFRVDCRNSITGTYPDVKHRVSYTIYLQHTYSENSTQYNGAVLNFGGNSHSVDINVSGIGEWELASGTLEYTFATNNRVDSRNIHFSTNFKNVSASGTQTESATISIPNIKDIELSSTYNSVTYKASLESNPYDFYTIKATLDNASKIGTYGIFEGLMSDKEYEVNCYVIYRGDTSVLLDNHVIKSIKTLVDQFKLAYNTNLYQTEILTKDGVNILAKNGDNLIVDTIGNERLRTAKVFYNNNGVIKKVKAAYYNKKGNIQHYKNYGN
ncbi:MAG: hypothetical protein MR967_01180 [Holdemanella sp.]|uniref:hypothetical protein n=1 Tax=Holdemanella sp. TaxID=1971762 RepID=UPI00258A30A2|nr:hypothetical protein [Holdemanella sp.]MCI7165544.1 hypothetical protein [Holdemanella sp.]